jgi:hypothetical protein
MLIVGVSESDRDARSLSGFFGHLQCSELSGIRGGFDGLFLMTKINKCCKAKMATTHNSLTAEFSETNPFSCFRAYD